LSRTGHPDAFCFIVDVGSGPESRQRLENLLGNRGDDLVLVVSPRTPARDHLPIAVFGGPGIKPGLLTSATTRTPGVIANIDVAPTILSWFNTPAPATMTGHPIVQTPHAHGIDEILELDRIISLNERGLVPTGLALAALVVITMAGGLLSVWRMPRAAPVFAFLALALLNMPLGMLLASRIPAHTISEYAAVILGLMAGLAASQTALSKVIPGNLSPSALATAATVLVVAVDALFGQPLVKFAMISGYQVQGIRFYGIGNEYMGIILGMTLLAVFLSGIPRWAAAAVFVMVTSVIGLPGLGADAGGTIGASVGFGCGWTALRRGKVRWADAALWAVIGVGVAFGLAFADRFLLSRNNAPSHLGGALQSAGRRGYGYLWAIVERKVMMNVRIAQHPAVLAAIGTIGTVGWLAGSALRSRAIQLAADNPRWAKALAPVCWGALAAFLFNDSGVVAGIFALGSFVMTGLYLLFEKPVSA
jgi:hypothetical protein